MQAEEVRSIRRWLWAELSVRPSGRPPPPAAARWMGDSQLACAEIKRALAMVREAGEVSPTDARAWAADATLDGQRRPKQEIAASLGLSPRGLGGRLTKVDAAIGRTLARWPSPQARHVVGPIEEVVAARTAEAAAVLDGELEVADAFHRVAGERGGEPSLSPRAQRGTNRVRRSRALRSARRAVPRLAMRPPPIPRLQRTDSTDKLIAVPYVLHEEPAAAVAELERAWKAGAVHAYPVLIDNAFRQVPSLRRAGPALRLRLLEIVSDILRDTESLLTLPVATMWLREARAALGPHHRHVVAATRTRGHVLQLHGHLKLAAQALDGAVHLLQSVPFASEHDRRMEWIDLLMRRGKVEVARGSAANAELLEHLLALVHAAPEARTHPLPPRLQLHLLALRIQPESWPGSPPKRLQQRYETSQMVLLDRVDRSTGSHPLAMLDTLLISALRTGEGDAFIEHLLDQRLASITADPAYGNQLHRMRQRLVDARRRGVTRVDIAAVPETTPTLRVDGTLPDVPQYRV
jgi:hypothetical protein